jgi:hypothetical protein
LDCPREGRKGDRIAAFGGEMTWVSAKKQLKIRKTVKRSIVAVSALHKGKIARNKDFNFELRYLEQI